MSIQQVLQQLSELSLLKLQTQVLLTHLLDCDQSFLFAHPEYVLTKKEKLIWKTYHEKLYQGLPVTYIIKQKEFYGRSFYIDERVLIPRPETEQMVRFALELKEADQVRILELGTGSGVIIISLALELKKKFKNQSSKIKMLATDIADDVLDVARVNAGKYDLTGIDFRRGDLFEPVRGEKFDLILANLPYLPTQEARKNKFEPQIALDGGADGIEFNRCLLEQVENYLNPKGSLIYEDYGGVVKQIKA